jgi:hypothetical protein
VMSGMLENFMAYEEDRGHLNTCHNHFFCGLHVYKSPKARQSVFSSVQVSAMQRSG